MLQPSETSYFSQPAGTLDPRLFKNEKLDASVRSAILQLMFNCLNQSYTGAERWATAWLAGSGVSYQWAAHREPADLDCIVGVNYASFRAANDPYRGLSDTEIQSMLNEGFRAFMGGSGDLFMGVFELTFFAILSTHITDIKPYAAYALLDDKWVVSPNRELPVTSPEWEASAKQDADDAIMLTSRFITSRNKYEHATNAAVKANARSEMRVASSQAGAMYNAIHSNRSIAFSTGGSGYGDFNNFRWQAGKRSGVIQTLRAIKSEMEAQDAEATKATYGVDLPDTSTLIRRAATYRQ